MLDSGIKIEGTPTYDGVMIEETLNDMRISLAEYKLKAIDDIILKSMSDEILLDLYHKVEREKTARRL